MTSEHFDPPCRHINTKHMIIHTCLIMGQASPQMLPKNNDSRHDKLRWNSFSQLSKVLIPCEACKTSDVYKVEIIWYSWLMQSWEMSVGKLLKSKTGNYLLYSTIWLWAGDSHWSSHGKTDQYGSISQCLILCQSSLISWLSYQSLSSWVPLTILTSLFSWPNICILLTMTCQITLLWGVLSVSVNITCKAANQTMVIIFRPSMHICYMTENSYHEII